MMSEPKSEFYPGWADKAGKEAGAADRLQPEDINPNTGKPYRLAVETRARMSEGQRKRWAVRRNRARADR